MTHTYTSDVHRDNRCLTVLGMEGDMEEAYKKWTVRRKSKHGYIVHCKKGMWGVEAPTKEEAEREAWRYFALYFGDGEYA